MCPFATDDLPFPDKPGGTILSWPLDLVKRSTTALGRRRKAARHRGELAALDPHVLADIGLRRSLVHPACLVTAPDE